MKREKNDDAIKEKIVDNLCRRLRSDTELLAIFLGTVDEDYTEIEYLADQFIAGADNPRDINEAYYLRRDNEKVREYSTIDHTAQLIATWSIKCGVKTNSPRCQRDGDLRERYCKHFGIVEYYPREFRPDWYTCFLFVLTIEQNNRWMVMSHQLGTLNPQVQAEVITEIRAKLERRGR